MEAVLSFATVIGPILLLGAIIWAWTRNRKTSDRVDRKAEQGARDLQRELEERPDKKADL